MARRALVIDDSITLRHMVAATLRVSGFDVTEAENGDAGLTCLDGAPFDVIVTDLNMPRMDGLTFVRHAREIAAYRTVPVVILTTECSDQLKSEARAAGASCWMVKPFSPDQLVDVVCRLAPAPALTNQ